jgi:ankyrin repeat protein
MQGKRQCAGLVILACLVLPAQGAAPARSAGGAAATPAQAAARQRLAITGVEVSNERLVQFAAQGDRTVVDLLLAAGASVNGADARSRSTALHNASAQGHLELVASLLERGGAVDARDWHGNTPLIEAAYAGHLAVVKLLLARGAAIDAVSDEGITALTAAIYADSPAIVAYLLAQGANASMPAQPDALPLQVARRRGQAALAALIERHLVTQLTNGNKP